jgi:hypothetical protein
MKATVRLAWYMLVHQLPPKPLYLRAKVRHRLGRAGAVALKNSVYVLPRRAELREELAAIARDAQDGGGEAYLCEASFTDPDVERVVVERFRSQADERYRALGRRLEGLGPNPSALSRLARRLDEVAKIDFFEAPYGGQIRSRLNDLRSALRRRTKRGTGGRSRGGGRTWFTRRGVHIDRIASAWLIRRFLDPAARFRFGDAREPGVEGEVSFDVPGGDYSHEDDRCTFETLVKRHGISDAALRHVAEIVHDVDMKDGKFRRPEAAGVERVVAGIVAGHSADPDRLERGAAFFEDLYRSFLVVR